MRLTRVFCPELAPLALSYDVGSDGGALQGADFVLQEETAHRLVRVMRLRDGDKFLALDGLGNVFEALLRGRGRHWSGILGLGSRPSTELPVSLTVYLAAVKGERFDWAVEKLTELGVRRLVPVETEFTQVRNASSDKVERWQRLAVSACEQCGGTVPMRVEAPLSWSQALGDFHLSRTGGPGVIFSTAEASTDMLSVAERHSEAPAWSLFVGPEGGFSPEECLEAGEASLIAVSLGRRILRVETAALAGVSMLLAGLHLA